MKTYKPIFKKEEIILKEDQQYLKPSKTVFKNKEN